MVELSVEVSESQETLKILYSAELRPVLNSAHLPLVHLNTLLVDDISQKINRGGGELAFL